MLYAHRYCFLPPDIWCVRVCVVRRMQGDCCKRLQDFSRAAAMYEASIECLRHAAEAGDAEVRQGALAPLGCCSFLAALIFGGSGIGEGQEPLIHRAVICFGLLSILKLVWSGSGVG